MTTQFEFSNDEWDQLAAVPFLVGMAVAKAEDSGFVGSLRESRTLMHSIGSQSETNPASGLIAQAATTDVTEHYERFKASDPEALAAEAVETCSQVATVLDTVAQPAEAKGYKQWLLDVGWTVAEAAKEHGQRVSPGEATLLARISGALGLPVRSQ